MQEGGIRDVKSGRASAMRKGRPQPGKHPLLSRGAALGELPGQNWVSYQDRTAGSDR